MAKKSRDTFAQIRARLRQQEASAAEPFTVVLTATAEKAYLEMHRRSAAAEAKGDATNQHCTTFRAVDHAIRKIIPVEALSRKYALHKPMEGFYRVAKGRLRIVWYPDLEIRTALVLYVSHDLRKEGDSKDPYVVLNAMARAGYLKSIVEDWRKALETAPDAPIH